MAVAYGFACDSAAKIPRATPEEVPCDRLDPVEIRFALRGVKSTSFTPFACSEYKGEGQRVKDEGRKEQRTKNAKNKEQM
jgi:hypothetical protein